MAEPEEQADANGAADRNQLDMAILEPTHEILPLVGLLFAQQLGDRSMRCFLPDV